MNLTFCYFLPPRSTAEVAGNKFRVGRGRWATQPRIPVEQAKEPENRGIEAGQQAAAAPAPAATEPAKRAHALTSGAGRGGATQGRR